MTRRDWWLGVAIVVTAIVVGFAIQTVILRNEIREHHPTGPTLLTLTQHGHWPN